MKTIPGAKSRENDVLVPLMNEYEKLALLIATLLRLPISIEYHKDEKKHT